MSHPDGGYPMARPRTGDPEPVAQARRRLQWAVDVAEEAREAWIRQVEVRTKAEHMLDDLEREWTCPVCDGSGKASVVGGTWETCQTCGGTGWRRV